MTKLIDQGRSLWCAMAITVIGIVLLANARPAQADIGMIMVGIGTLMMGAGALWAAYCACRGGGGGGDD